MHINKVRIVEEMQKQGIRTQTELAQKLGITKNQLSVMLSDGYNPLKTRVVELCDLLGVSPLDIMNSKVEVSSDRELDKDAVTCIELFAGAGGLALGLEKAGIETVQFVEIDSSCCETLRKNRPNWNVVCDDIHNIDFTSYHGKVDIVTGGFPCQAFSYAGKKLGMEDVRGTLFYEFARCVKEVSPKIFMAENVRGLVSHDNGRTLQTILSVFEELGYTVQYQILNAAYFDVPQKRERIVIVGIKNGVDITFDYPIPNKTMMTLREGLKDCPVSEGQAYSAKKKAVLELVPPGGCWIDLPEDIQRDFMGKSYFSGGGKRGMARRISWDEPCLTLTCSPSQKQTERCHPEETRPFTVREYARIQSFPDTWEFCGGIGDKYKQIGNAVPVNLGYAIGTELKNAILKYRIREAD